MATVKVIFYFLTNEVYKKCCDGVKNIDLEFFIKPSRSYCNEVCGYCNNAPSVQKTSVYCSLCSVLGQVDEPILIDYGGDTIYHISKCFYAIGLTQNFYFLSNSSN